jgi:hypothetical protein
MDTGQGGVMMASLLPRRAANWMPDGRSVMMALSARGGQQ